MGERAEDGLVGAAGKRGRHRGRVRRSTRRLCVGAPEQVRDLVEEGHDEVIVTRRLGSEGRNRCYINETAVTLSTMGESLSRLLSFAGQHEYRRLLDPEIPTESARRVGGAGDDGPAARATGALLKAQETARRLEEAQRSRENRATRARPSAL